MNKFTGFTEEDWEDIVSDTQKALKKAANDLIFSHSQVWGWISHDETEDRQVYIDWANHIIDEQLQIIEDNL